MTDRLRRVFVAGPFTGANDFERAENVRRAQRVCLTLAERFGVAYYSPHGSSSIFFGTVGEDYWLRMHREWIRDCDALAFLRYVDGRISSGTHLEIEEAASRGLPIFDWDERYPGLSPIFDPETFGTKTETFQRWLNLRERCQAQTIECH